MTERSPVIAPQVGIVTLLTLAFWPLVIAGFWDSELAYSGISFLSFAHLAAIGFVYGLVGAICWALTAVRPVVVRSVTRIVVALIASYALLRLLGPDHMGGVYLLRNAITFGGLMISQTALFFLLQVPEWHWGKRSEPSSGGRRFSIRGILMLTFCIAVVLAMAKNYQPPGKALHYWSYLIGIWTVLPILTAGCVASISSGSRSRNLPMMFGSLSLAASVAILLGRADELGSASWRIMSLVYAIMIASSMVVMVAVSYAGRLDALARRHVDDEPDPQNLMAANSEN